MTIYLRQATASQEIPLGYFLDSTDGNTEETGLTVANTDIKIWKTGATTLADKNSGGATHIANGIYYAVLDATDTDTIGPLVIYVHVSGALAIRLECCVLDEPVYDLLIAGGAPAANLLDMFDGTGYAGGTAKLTVDTVAISGDTTAADNAELMFDGTGYAGGTIKLGVNLVQILGTALTETAGQIAAAFKKFFDVATPTGTVNSLPDAVAGASGGVFIAGTNAATAITTALTANITGNITGNLSGSVGSVTGAVGSVTGAVGSVTGNVGGNVTGSIGSLATQAKADVNAEVDTALADVNLDHVAGTATGIPAIPAGTYFDQIMDDGTAVYDRTTDSLQAIRDRVDTEITAIINTLGTPAGVSLAADIAAIEAQTDDIGVAGAGLTALGDVRLANLDATVSSRSSHSAADIWSVVARTLTAGTNIVLAKGVGITGFNDLTAAQVNAEIVDALATDTYTQPGQEAPAATTTLSGMLRYLYKALRNRYTQTATEFKLYADDAVTVDQKATVSDDGVTFDRSEIGTGP